MYLQECDKNIIPGECASETAHRDTLEFGDSIQTQGTKEHCLKQDTFLESNFVRAIPKQKLGGTDDFCN